jgi:alpha-ketoglutarate-dependent taurine dioxygenase
MNMNYLDQNIENNGLRLNMQIHSQLAWYGTDINSSSCILSLDDKTLADVFELAKQIQSSPLPELSRSSSELMLGGLEHLMSQVRQQLSLGPGIAVIDALPMDDLGEDLATEIFWILGQLINPTVEQKWDGTMLYHVRDTGDQYKYGVRGSYTNVELVFHTDNAFAVAPPDQVGLLCLRPALSGGLSRFCSLYTVHNILLEQAPQALERLYHNLLWDRQAEHAPDAPKVLRAPMFHFDGQNLRVRANVSLVRKGYALAEQELDAETADALEALETITSDPKLWFELPIERGQMQYLNNREIAHYRSHFEDPPQPELKRHLLRTWHRGHGQRSYDG